MEGYAEVQAFVERYLRDGPLELPSLTTVSTDDLKTLAQQAVDGQHWAWCRTYLFELLARGHEPARTCSNLGRLFAETADIEEGLKWYRESLEHDPSQRDIHDELIFTMESQPETTPESSLRVREQYFQRFCEAAYQQRVPLLNNPDPERPLHIGYVGGDWNFHSACIAFSGVLLHHLNHPTGYIPHIYSSLHPLNQDFISKQWQSMFGTRFVEAFGLTPSQLAAVIRHDEIDILVDLSGYTARHRLETFAYKPAPIQIQAWGFVVGTGSPMMDVIFGDPIVCPPCVKATLTERVYELPCILGYAPRDVYEETTPLPCLTGPVTFGVFQRACKLNHETLRVWRRVLEAVPDSQIMFKAPDYTSARRLKIVQALAGFEGRITFGPNTTHSAHLNYYQQIDLSLDPWPQTGGISTLESLSMGVPMVTLVKPDGRMIERTSASILTNVGFQECIAHTEDEYVEIAVRLVTTDRGRLAAMRETARVKLEASPIMTGYGDAVETAYRTLWREWCATQQEQVAPRQLVAVA